MMMDGDYYAELNRAKGGYTISWDPNNKSTQIANNCGALARKHIVGSIEDHIAEAGFPSQFMKTALSTHILRLADVYLVYAEAFLPSATSTTTDASALAAFNAVRSRAGVAAMTSISFKDVLDERRRELAFEGDNWFDYVRLSYFDMATAKALLKAQRRGWYEGGTAYDTPTPTYHAYQVNPTDASFTLPMPESEILADPKLGPNEPTVPVDWSTITF
jgi:hypothetical protein